MTLTTDLTDNILPIGDGILAHPSKGGTWRLVTTEKADDGRSAIHIIEDVRWFAAVPADGDDPAVEAQWTAKGEVEAIAVTIREVEVHGEDGKPKMEDQLSRPDNAAWPHWGFVGKDPALLRLYAKLLVARADALETIEE